MLLVEFGQSTISVDVPLAFDPSDRPVVISERDSGTDISIEDGVPPHAGGTMGFDRLLMGMLELRDIQEGIAFPRDRNMIV